MTATNTPKVYYVVSIVINYISFEEAKTKSPDDFAAHISRSKALHAQGVLLRAGAFLDNPEEPLSTMAVLNSRAAAKKYIKGDPFVLKGMTAWYIRKWAKMFLNTMA